MDSNACNLVSSIAFLIKSNQNMCKCCRQDIALVNSACHRRALDVLGLFHLNYTQVSKETCGIAFGKTKSSLTKYRVLHRCLACSLHGIHFRVKGNWLLSLIALVPDCLSSSTGHRWSLYKDILLVHIDTTCIVFWKWRQYSEHQIQYILFPFNPCCKSPTLDIK